MRVVYIGASHWHLPIYLNPVLKMEDASVVGIHDPSKEVASSLGRKLGCEWSSDYRELCERTAPDFAFVLGRHCDMAEAVAHFVEQGIPCAVEKPCGLSAAEVEGIAEKAAASGHFVAVPLVFRQSDLVSALRKMAPLEELKYLSFKFISKPATHYLDDGCPWMLDKTQAGGGALINVGFHFIDLLQFLFPQEPLQVEASLVRSTAFGYSVEDYALVGVRAGDAVGVVETGYIYPAAHEYMDMHYSICGEGRYFVVKGPQELEVSDSSGRMERLAMGTTNVSYYPAFIADTLRRAREGAPPVAGLFDAAAALRAIERAYELAGVGRQEGRR